MNAQWRPGDGQKVSDEQPVGGRVECVISQAADGHTIFCPTGELVIGIWDGRNGNAFGVGVDAVAQSGDLHDPARNQAKETSAQESFRHYLSAISPVGAHRGDLRVPFLQLFCDHKRTCPHLRATTRSHPQSNLRSLVDSLSPCGITVHMCCVQKKLNRTERTVALSRPEHSFRSRLPRVALRTPIITPRLAPICTFLKQFTLRHEYSTCHAHPRMGEEFIPSGNRPKAPPKARKARASPSAATPLKG